jgi:hypothetical protein
MSASRATCLVTSFYSLVARPDASETQRGEGYTISLTVEEFLARSSGRDHLLSARTATTEIRIWQIINYTGALSTTLVS